VPNRLQKRTLAKLELPAEITESLAKRKVYNLGGLLYEWGLDPKRLGLNDESEELLLEKLGEVPDLDPSWLEDAPWRQWNPDFVWGAVAWLLVFGVIGARLYHVLTPTPSQAPAINSALDYFRNPQELINIRSGGLGIFGAFLGGLVAIILYTRRQRISAIAWADLAVVGMALGQFVGRWGNFFNQELYGSPSQLPWAIYIDSPLPGYEQFIRFQPTFLYESLWNLANFLILYTLAHRYRDKLQRGDLLALYLVFYGVGRILLELIRLDSRTFSFAGADLGIPVATVVSIAIAVPMAALLLYRHVFSKEEK
jgi:phosphatidylglycerol:prolipoprotein diacylglycerol transferase